MDPITEAEREQRKRVLESILRDLDVGPRTRAERHLLAVQAAKDEARSMDRELLTPLAARELFGKSPATVRRAVAEGHVEAPITLQATARPVSLLRLSSAARYWGVPDPGLLSEMRSAAHVMSVSGLGYAILTPKPLYDFGHPTDMEWE